MDKDAVLGCLFLLLAAFILVSCSAPFWAISYWIVRSTQ